MSHRLFWLKVKMETQLYHICSITVPFSSHGVISASTFVHSPLSHSGLFPLLFVFVLSLISLFFFFNLTSVCFPLAALAFFSSYLLGLRCALFSFSVTPSPPFFLVSSGFSFWKAEELFMELSLPNLRTLVILWC